jgi:hypothetical protein
MSNAETLPTLPKVKKQIYNTLTLEQDAALQKKLIATWLLTNTPVNCNELPTKQTTQEFKLW